MGGIVITVSLVKLYLMSEMYFFELEVIRITNYIRFVKS
jgi:hypothetical protein